MLTQEGAEIKVRSPQAQQSPSVLQDFHRQTEKSMTCRGTAGTTWEQVG